MTGRKNTMPSSTRKKPAKKPTRYWLLIAIIAVLTSCSKAKIPNIKLPLPNIVYKVDIQQGNVITQEVVDQLKPGMDKKRVRFILGTPLVVSAFNNDRWDYVYSFQEGGRDREQRRLSLFFKDDKLQHMEGDIVVKTCPKDLEKNADPTIP